MKIPNFCPKFSRLTISVRALVIVGVIMVVYSQDLLLLGNEVLLNELWSYVLVVPLLIIFVLYRKRKVIRSVISSELTNYNKKEYTNEILGILLCCTAFLLYWHGSYTFYPLEYHLFSLPLFTAGLILIFFNLRTLKELILPIAFLFLLVPPPLEIMYTLGATLSKFSSTAAYDILKILGLPVTLANQYGTPIILLQKSEFLPLTFTIDPACAGVYSLIGFAIFSIFISYLAKGPKWKKTTIFLVGIPLIYALNITRITIIVLLGNQYGMETATRAFHILGGWASIILGSIILLFITEKIFKLSLFHQKTPQSECNHCKQNPENINFCNVCGKLLKNPKIKFSKQDLPKILLLALSAIIIVNLQTPVFTITKGLPEINTQTLTGEQTATNILPPISGYTPRFIYRNRDFEELSKQDASLVYAYFPTNKSEETIWVTIEIGKTKSALHSWEVCLITWPLTHGQQPTVQQKTLKDIQLMQNPTLTARYFAFKDTESNQTQIVLYWYESAVFNTDSSQEQKYLKTSIITFTENPQEIPEHEEKILPFAKAISGHWQPIKTSSQISTLIYKNGPSLIGAIITSIAIFLLYLFMKDREKKKLNLNLYNKLTSPEENLILKAVHQTSKKGKSTTNQILQQYQQLAKKPIELNHLNQKLKQAEKAGLITKAIINHEDEPIMIWKSNLPTNIF